MSSPNYLLSVFSNKCPRCRKGNLYRTPNPYNFKLVYNMHEHCPVCNLKFELEPGFWYGTGYMSYGLSVAFSLFNLGWFYLIFGLSWNGNSLLAYLITNTTILIACLPFIMRLSRTAYLSIFVKYDKNAASSKQ